MSNWGEPLKFERRAAPAAAICLSILIHLGVSVAVPPSTRTAIAPVLQATSGEVAIQIEKKYAVENLKTSIVARTVPSPCSSVEPEPIRPELVELGSRVPDAAPLGRTSETPLRTEESVQPARPELKELPESEALEGVRAVRLVAGQARPHYPFPCRAGLHRPGGCEGRGSYEVEIDASGRVLSVELRESAGCPELDRSAIEFLQKARFEPPGRHWKGAVFVRFRLDDEPQRGDKSAR